MAKDAYTLKKKEETEELHIFKSKFTDDSCSRGSISMCKAMKVDEQEGDNIFACKDENEARTRCAKAGRKVCGNCVSQLYTTYN